MLLNRTRADRVMEREGLDGLIATTHENVTYLTGHHGDYWFIRATIVYGVLAHGDRKSLLVAPASHVCKTVPDGTVIVGYGGFPPIMSEVDSLDEDDRTLLKQRSRVELSSDATKALFHAIRESGLSESRVAVDERNFTRRQFADLQREFPKAEFVDGYETFRTIRAVKTAEEIERLRRSAQATEDGLRRAVAIMKEGVSEQELERAFYSGVVEAGAVPLFAVICSGHRSAHTNTVPSDRKIKAGDIARFDVGSRYLYYSSDLARTYVVGGPTADDELRWNAIVAGQKAAIDVMRPGVTAGHVFRVAVEAARDGGLPRFERHHVGHGIGIDMYDIPSLTPNNDTQLEEGMVVCVETPYYELGFGGFQVEDAVVIHAGGTEALSSLPRDLAFR